MSPHKKGPKKKKTQPDLEKQNKPCVNFYFAGKQASDNKTKSKDC